jgi:hypothetical protein
LLTPEFPLEPSAKLFFFPESQKLSEHFTAEDAEIAEQIKGNTIRHGSFPCFLGELGALGGEMS